MDTNACSTLLSPSSTGPSAAGKKPRSRSEHQGNRMALMNRQTGQAAMVPEKATRVDTRQHHQIRLRTKSSAKFKASILLASHTLHSSWRCWPCVSLGAAEMSLPEHCMLLLQFLLQNTQAAGSVVVSLTTSMKAKLPSYQVQTLHCQVAQDEHASISSSIISMPDVPPFTTSGQPHSRGVVEAAGNLWHHCVRLLPPNSHLTKLRGHSCVGPLCLPITGSYIARNQIAGHAHAAATRGDPLTCC